MTEFIRGRVDPLPDCDFVMTASHMWDPNFKTEMETGILNQAESEQPLNMFIFDIPEAHKYLNQNADNFLEALSATEEVKIFDNRSIRAIIEMKWPLIRKGVVRKLFIPYLIFLFSFLFYSVYIFERLNKQPGQSFEPAPVDPNSNSSATQTLLFSDFRDDPLSEFGGDYTLSLISRGGGGGNKETDEPTQPTPEENPDWANMTEAER